MVRADLVIAGSNFIFSHISSNYEKFFIKKRRKLLVVFRGINTSYFNPQKTSPSKLEKFCKKNNIYTGWPISIWTILKSGCGIQMSQVTPIKFSMLFKHIYGKRFWKFGDHCFNISLFHGPSWSRVLDSIHRYGVILTFLEKKFKGHCEAIVDVKIIHFIDL